MTTDDLFSLVCEKPGRTAYWRCDPHDLDKCHNFQVTSIMDELRKVYASVPGVVDHMNAMEQDVLEHVEDFRTPEEPAPAVTSETPWPPLPLGQLLFRRYQVNVVVDNREAHGAPVVYEDHPMVHNLMGRIEHLRPRGPRRPVSAPPVPPILTFPLAGGKGTSGIALDNVPVSSRAVGTSQMAWQ